MKITINKDSVVPIRDQIIEQVGLQIAAGILQHKEKLPSIRSLAQRLGIHYSTVTAAYNHLAEVGLLDIRQGSGVRVAGRTDSVELNREKDLDAMVDQFLARAQERGYSREQLKQAYERIANRPPLRRILAVDANVDFHPILLAELMPHFDLPVQTCTIEQLKSNNHNDALIVTSLYHLFAFQELISDPTRLIVCNIEPGRAEIETATQLPAGSLVLLVSVSETLTRIATKLVAANRGEEIAVRSVVPSDLKELNYMIKHADLIICDISGEKAVLPISGKKKILNFRLYAPSTIDLIKDRIAKWG